MNITPSYKIVKGSKYPYKAIDCFLHISPEGNVIHTTYYSLMRTVQGYIAFFHSGYAIDGCSGWLDTARNIGPAFEHDLYWQLVEVHSDIFIKEGIDILEWLEQSNATFVKQCKHNGCWLLGRSVTKLVLDIVAKHRFRKIIKKQRESKDA